MPGIMLENGRQGVSGQHARPITQPVAEARV
jgi:hypothetical protein